MSFRLIDEMQTKAIPVAQSCRVLGVSRSGFYQSEASRRSADGLQSECPCACSFHGQPSKLWQPPYGKELANRGVTAGHFKVRRLMRQVGLKPVWKRKFVHTTDSKHDLPIAANVLARRFNPAAPNKAYVSDITYVRTGAGWLYLAVVIDLYSRKVVGWAMAPSMPAKLVCDALHMAVQQRRPGPGLIVHSDRGSQYASAQYQAKLASHGFICSMSRKGNCWDNAVAERFFLNLKMERVWQREYANHAEATIDIAAYIVGFYNSERLHSVLGNLPPAVYERNMAAKKPIVVSEFT